MIITATIVSVIATLTTMELQLYFSTPLTDGNPSVGDQMKPALVAAGEKVGINFKPYAALSRYRPTILSHRLIELSKRQNKQDAMVERIFKG